MLVQNNNTCCNFYLHSDYHNFVKINFCCIENLIIVIFSDDLMLVVWLW